MVGVFERGVIRYNAAWFSLPGDRSLYTLYSILLARRLLAVHRKWCDRSAIHDCYRDKVAHEFGGDSFDQYGRTLRRS